MKNLLAFSITLTVFLAFGQKNADSADLYFKKAMSFEYVSLDSMLFYANKLQKLGEHNNDPVLKASYHALAGVGLQETGNYDSAIYHQQQALQYGLAAADSNQIALAYQHLGVINKFLANYDIALQYFFDALRIADRMGNDHISAMGNLTVAQIHYGMGRYKEGMEFAQKCIDIARRSDNKRALSGGLIERGNSRTMLANLDGALTDFKEAEQLIREYDLPEGLANIYNNIGVIHFYKGDFRRAIIEYLKGKEEAEASNDPANAGIGLLNTGEAYIYLEEYEQAEKHLLLSLDQFKELRNKQFIANNYEYLHQMELQKEDHKAALKYFKLKDLYEDSILNENNLATISDLKVTYETEKKEQQLQLLTAQSLLQTAELEKTRNFVFFLILLLICAVPGIMLYNSRKHYKLKAQLAEEKEHMQKARFKAVIDAEEKERKRIARELHDGLGQILSTARITISCLDEEEENQQVQNSIKLIDHAVDELRSISHNMMPNALISVGIDAALEDMIRKINQAGKIQTILERKTSLNLDESKSIATYRVVQEVLNNALKYSDADTINVIIGERDSSYEITIRDNGKGFDPAAIDNSSGIGWPNMQSRIELIGGDIRFFSKPTEGTLIKFTVPQHDHVYRTAAS